MFTDQELEKLSDFNKGYSFNLLASIDKKVHSKMLNEFFKKYPKHEKLIAFDIGSNAGSFIKVFQQHSKGTIHCFEPHPILHNYLKKTYKNIIVNDCCVSNYNGIGKIYLPSRSIGLSSTIYRKEFDKLKISPEDNPKWNSKEPQKIIEKNVTFITLNHYCQINNINIIDYIKIDVEGGEFNVFTGASNLLKEHRILAGQYEAKPESSCLKDAGITYNKIKNYLEDFGYTVTQLCSNDCFFYLQK